jgi:hypothetical protein
LKIDNLKVVPAKPGTPQLKTVVKASNSELLTANVAHPAGQVGASVTKHTVAGEERRRSQRVLLRVKANIHLALQGKNSTFEVTTLSVNDHGALIVLPRSLPIDTRLVLEHAMTKQRVACKIVRPAREMPEGFHIPLEFDSPEPNFWGISFPPTDWRPPDDF